MSKIAPTAVYVLCLLTSIVCSILLLRAYIRTKGRLLLWTAISFVFLSLNNLCLVADLVIFPDVDLTFLRQGTTLLALATLLYGFIWEVER
ncbi:MAG TPA: DUF5985 family protein [Caulobacteraceae bacterium]|jgi:hypothetical protein|nr:DUF5985 family protein [Caulobacteraceae bacterium]